MTNNKEIAMEKCNVLVDPAHVGIPGSKRAVLAKKVIEVPMSEKHLYVQSVRTLFTGNPRSP